MGELCLRWAMKLPANVPLTADGSPLRQEAAPRLFAHWENLGLVPVTRSFPIIGQTLIALDDAAFLPRLSRAFLARQIGVVEATARYTVRRFASIGHRLQRAGQDERRALLSPE